MLKLSSKLKIAQNQNPLNLLTILLGLTFFLVFVGYSPAGAKIPKVKLAAKALDLNRAPTTHELMAAGQLGGQLYPTDDIEVEEFETDTQNQLSSDQKKKQSSKLDRKKAINLSFGKAIQAWNKHEYRKGVELFKKHVEEFPDSPWAAEAELHIGCDARYHGRYTEAEEKFMGIIRKYQGKKHEGARRLVDKAHFRMGALNILENNYGEAKTYFSILKKEALDWRHRTYASHWIKRLSRLEKDKIALLNCGVQALAVLLEKEGRHSEANQVRRQKPSSIKGHSLLNLKEIATDYGYDLIGLRVTVDELEQLQLPAIVQIDGRKQGDSGHYWLLEKKQNDRLTLIDPQNSHRFQQKTEEFNREWNGIALVFQNQKNLPGTLLSSNELTQIYCGCCGAEMGEGDLGDDEENMKRGGRRYYRRWQDPCGSPVWEINMINLNLHITDIPLWYNNPIGPSVEITLHYNSQSAIAYNEPFGNKWQFNYGSYLVVDTGGNVLIYMPDGRRDLFTPDGSGGYNQPYRVYNKLTKIAENHFELRFPDDTVFIYDIPDGTTSLQPFLVEIKDAYDQSLTFHYNTDVKLDTVTDALGRTTTLTYNTDGLVTQVADPFGRIAAFEYDADRNLVRITDMGGYWTELDYDDDIYLTRLSNHRGDWTFYFEPADGIVANSNNYSPPGDDMWENYRITITNPLGGKEEYFYYGGVDALGEGYTWYISPRHYIPWQSQNVNNYRIDTPRTRYFFTTMATSQKDEISKITYPEGGFVEYEYDTLTGLRTSVKDSHSHITSYTYNHMGNITSTTDAKGVVTNRTYAANGVDLLEISNGLGSTTMTYNDTHDITSIVDRMGHETLLTYNSYGQLTSITDTAGDLDIVTTYSYDPTSHQLVQTVKDGNILESLTYDAIGRIKTRTDATNLMLSYDYNDLNHITQITHPDGKFSTNTYTGCCPRLIESTTDRNGRTTTYRYDALKQLVETVNPEGGLEQNVYDANGNRVQFIDPNGNITQYEYDNDDRLVKKIFADDKAILYHYDAEGLLTSRTNARGIHANYSYDANHNLEEINYSDCHRRI